MATLEIVTFLENVASMPADVQNQYSAWMGFPPILCGWAKVGEACHQVAPLRRAGHGTMLALVPLSCDGPGPSLSRQRCISRMVLHPFLTQVRLSEQQEREQCTLSPVNSGTLAIVWQRPRQKQWPGFMKTPGGFLPQRTVPKAFCGNTLSGASPSQRSERR